MLLCSCTSPLAEDDEFCRETARVIFSSTLLGISLLLECLLNDFGRLNSPIFLLDLQKKQAVI